jgi:hypothetical protein
VGFIVRSAFSKFVALLNSLIIVLLTPGSASPCAGDRINQSETVRAQSIELLLKARGFAADAPSGEAPDVDLGDIALDLAKLDEIEQARRTFAMISSDSLRDRAQKPFLEIQLQANDFAGAQLTVDAMKTPQGRALALCSVASTQWINRKSDAARDTYAARRTLSEAERIFAEHRAELTNAVFVSELVLTQDELGLGESLDAIKTKRILASLSGGVGFSADRFEPAGINSDSEKLRVIARAQMQHGDLEGARSNLRTAADSIETVPTPGDRGVLLNVIANDQVQAGDPEGARKSFAQAIERALVLPEGNLRRNLVIRDVASDQASSGDIEGGLATAAQISDVHLRDQALDGIAVAEAEQVGLEWGLKIAERISTEQEFDKTLVQISRYFGKHREPSTVMLIADKIHSQQMKAVALQEAAEATMDK